jgi:3'-5' exonuclease
MIDSIKLEDVLFLDIETVPHYQEYGMVPDHLKPLWDHKAGFLSKDGKTPNELYERAGIYAEFGKVICISIGVIIKSKEEPLKIRIKSIAGDSEKDILAEFIDLLNKHYNKPRHLLCAHNGKEFDFPFLSRRIIINGLKLPKILCIAGKKPWEVQHLDTMELWKFGDYKHYSSLNLLAAIFNIEGPKNDISGKDVAKVYYKEKNLKRIVEYCQRDVLTVARILLKYQGDKEISNENVVLID